MTIEISPPTANAKVASAKAPSGTSAKTGQPESGQPPGASGFMAILAAADEVVPAGLTLGDGTPCDNAPDALAVGVDGKDDSTDATALLTQALQWMANPIGIPSPTNSMARNGNNASIDTDPSVVRATNLNLGVAEPAKSPIQMVKVGAASVVAPESAVRDAGGGIFANGAKGALTGETVGMPRKTAKDAKDAKDAMALQSANAVAVGSPATDSSRFDDRSVKLLAHGMEAKPELAKAEPVLQMVGATAKREEQTIHGAAKASAAMDVGGVWGSASSAGIAGDSAVYSGGGVADASALMPAYVAEKVSYWISNDVQSAEMKLQGLGDSPVEVRISMVGNEAHVAFRTDEAQARDALENASAHLRDMLQRDGVVLSGVSVGTSGSGGAGNQDQRPSQGRQKSAVMVEAPVRTESRSRGVGQAGRALDLFV